MSLEQNPGRASVDTLVAWGLVTANTKAWVDSPRTSLHPSKQSSLHTPNHVYPPITTHVMRISPPSSVVDALIHPTRGTLSVRNSRQASGDACRDDRKVSLPYGMQLFPASVFSRPSHSRTTLPFVWRPRFACMDVETESYTRVLQNTLQYPSPF